MHYFSPNTICAQYSSPNILCQHFLLAHDSAVSAFTTGYLFHVTSWIKIATKMGSNNLSSWSLDLQWQTGQFMAIYLSFLYVAMLHTSAKYWFTCTYKSWSRVKHLPAFARVILAFPQERQTPQVSIWFSNIAKAHSVFSLHIKFPH